jgi:hypothetical protein
LTACLTQTAAVERPSQPAGLILTSYLYDITGVSAKRPRP